MPRRRRTRRLVALRCCCSPSPAAATATAARRRPVRPPRRDRGLLRTALRLREPRAHHPLHRRARHERVRLRAEERSAAPRPVADALSRGAARRSSATWRASAPRAASASTSRSHPASPTTRTTPPTSSASPPSCAACTSAASPASRCCSTICSTRPRPRSTRSSRPGLTERVAALVASFGSDTDLWFISHVYTGLADDLRANRGLFAALSPLPPQVYYDAYAALVRPELPIMWTGSGRVLGAPHARTTRKPSATSPGGRPLVVWDNFPVNDSIAHELFLGPYLGRAADLSQAVDGVVLNLMTPARGGADRGRDRGALLRRPGGLRSRARLERGDRRRRRARRGRAAAVRRAAPRPPGARRSDRGGRARAPHRRRVRRQRRRRTARDALRTYLEALAANQRRARGHRRRRAAARRDRALVGRSSRSSRSAGLAGLDALGGSGSRRTTTARRATRPRPQPWLVAATISQFRALRRSPVARSIRPSTASPICSPRSTRGSRE